MADKKPATAPTVTLKHLAAQLAEEHQLSKKQSEAMLGDLVTQITKHLKKGLNDLQAATMWLMQNAMAKPDNAGAASNDYMHLFGLVALGFMWARMAKIAEEKLGSGEGNKAFFEAKLVTARYYFERIMPESAAHLARIQSGADSMMALNADTF